MTDPVLNLPYESESTTYSSGSKGSSRSRQPMCPNCHRGHMHRTHRESALDFLVSVVGVYPTVCRHCNGRGHGLRVWRLGLAVVAAATMLGATVAYVVRRDAANHSRAQAGAAAATAPSEVARKSTPAANTVETAHNTPADLTNQDVIDLVKHGMSSQFIKDLIHRSGHDFRFDVHSLVLLKNAGVSDDVIFAMVDSPAGSSNKSGAQPAGNLPTDPSASEPATPRKP